MVIAYDSEGRLDKAFGADGRFLVPAHRGQGYTAFTAVEPLASGKLLVSGYLRGQLSVVRLTAAGELDPSFGGGDGIATVAPEGAPAECCAAAGRLLVSEGRIIVAGRTARGAERPLLLARLDPSGRLDPSFGADGRVVGVPKREDTTFFIPRALAVQGKRILVAGSHEVAPFVKGAPIEEMTVIAFRPNGQVDADFGEKGVQTVAPGREALAINATQLGGGRVLLGGAIDDRGFLPLLKRYGH